MIACSKLPSQDGARLEMEMEMELELGMNFVPSVSVLNVDRYAGPNRPRSHVLEAKYQSLFFRCLFRCPCKSLVVS